MTSVTDEEFVTIYEKIADPGEEQFKEMMKNEKNIAYENLDNAEEFEQYRKIQDLELKQNNAQSPKHIFHEFHVGLIKSILTIFPAQRAWGYS